MLDRFAPFDLNLLNRFHKGDNIALIDCPECRRKISDRADFCPECGLPSEYFYKEKADIIGEISLDGELIINELISFEREHANLFDPTHYITGKEKKKIIEGHGGTFTILSESSSEIEEFKHDITDQKLLNFFLRNYRNITRNVEHHNRMFVDRALNSKKDYFDLALKEFGPDMMLDEEQRKAVVTDDDYCLLIAGAGAGKTTTMAAKVRYLVEEKGVDPNEILVISFTNKAVDELRERINDKLGMGVKISTFHSLGFDIIKKNRCPEVIYSQYGMITNILQKIILDDRKLLEKLILFFGYYFDIEDDFFNSSGSLNEFHKAKASRDYETLRSNIEGHIQKVGDQRMSRMKTLTGEYLRSSQEVQIANFLYLNNIDYEYEKIYSKIIKGSNKKYTPDFYITQGELNVYLEHYGVSESGISDGVKDPKRYKKNIHDKRKHHKKHKTTLIETWSSYYDGRSLLTHLEEILRKKGFVLKPRDPKEVYNKIIETGKEKYTSQFTLFIETFIRLYKTAGYGEEGFEKLREMTSNVRSLLFLDIVEKIYSEYMDALQRENKIDFADMINEAVAYLDEIENDNLPYKYIIIDEFQDIARQRFILINKLSKVTDAKITAVGDDWQSIFAFAGSDISLFTHFVENMGHGTELRINNTYRNSQELIDIAGQFIQKNTAQKKKRLISKKRIREPIAIRPYDDGERPLFAKGKVVEEIIGEILTEFGENSSILLLGRYGFDGDNLSRSGYFNKDFSGKITSIKYPQANLTFMTAHGSKGLGYDNVVILNMSEGKYGFPCQIEDDPIMKLVTTDDNSIPFAEERRLFYVALTRTKNRAYVAAPIRRPSRFLIELIKDCDLSYPHNMNMKIIDPIDIRCPRCKYPLRYEHNRTYGLPLYICTNDPEACGFMTNNREYKHDIFKCPSCEDGYMIVRKKENRPPFYGCTEYKKDGTGCNHTEKIEMLISK